jgi:hypothetical protein
MPIAARLLQLGLTLAMTLGVIAVPKGSVERRLEAHELRPDTPLHLLMNNFEKQVGSATGQHNGHWCAVACGGGQAWP